jgi:hypothetical protein
MAIVWAILTMDAVPAGSVATAAIVEAMAGSAVTGFATPDAMHAEMCAVIVIGIVIGMTVQGVVVEVIVWLPARPVAARQAHVAVRVLGVRRGFCPVVRRIGPLQIVQIVALRVSHAAPLRGALQQETVARIAVAIVLQQGARLRAVMKHVVPCHEEMGESALRMVSGQSPLSVPHPAAVAV